MPLSLNVDRVRVTVNSTALDRMFLPGGDVWAWGRNVRLEMAAVAMETTPSRTGYMRTQNGSVETPRGRRDIQLTVYNDAPYAMYVHNGTTGPIYSSRPGGMLLVRPSPYSNFHRFVPLEEVDGQSAQPWLRNAMEDVLARHGIR
jgi:hypothetical protein